MSGSRRPGVSPDPDRSPWPDLPPWLAELRDGAAAIPPERLSTFSPPEGADPRPGAVLMLFADGPRGRELLLTERAHHMRSHPGQVSFPGGAVDPGETAEQAALREAQEEVGIAPATVAVFGRLPVLWLPPSNFAVTPVLAWWHDPGDVGVVSEDEVHAVHRVPLTELLDPAHRISVRHPSGWVGPGFLIGEDNDVILWGFTGGIISRMFDWLGWTRTWDSDRVRDLPEHMLAGAPPRPYGTGSESAADPGTDQRRGFLDISDEEDE